MNLYEESRNLTLQELRIVIPGLFLKVHLNIYHWAYEGFVTCKKLFIYNKSLRYINLADCIYKGEVFVK